MAASAARRAAITFRSVGPITFHSSSLARISVLTGWRKAASPIGGRNPPPKGPGPGAGRDVGEPPTWVVWADPPTDITRATVTPTNSVLSQIKACSFLWGFLHGKRLARPFLIAAGTGAV
jgi:hypothetical protein